MDCQQNFALPDTLSRNTPPELITRKTTAEIPQTTKFFLAKDNISTQLECKYAVKADYDWAHLNNLQEFQLYLDCQNNHYEEELLGNSTFKPIPNSSCPKNKLQTKPLIQKMYRTNLFLLLEKQKLN